LGENSDGGLEHHDVTGKPACTIETWVFNHKLVNDVEVAFIAGIHVTGYARATLNGRICFLSATLLVNGESISVAGLSVGMGLLSKTDAVSGAERLLESVGLTKRLVEPEMCVYGLSFLSEGDQIVGSEVDDYVLKDWIVSSGGKEIFRKMIAVRKYPHSQWF
jgi:hypothetical protein